jgi:hypothetical protein
VSGEKSRDVDPDWRRKATHTTHKEEAEKVQVTIEQKVQGPAEGGVRLSRRVQPRVRIADDSGNLAHTEGQAYE